MCGKLCLRILTELEKEDNQKQTGSLADLSHNCSYRGFSCLGQTGETGGREEGDTMLRIFFSIFIHILDLTQNKQQTITVFCCT